MKLDKEWVLQRLYEEPDIGVYTGNDLPDCNEIHLQMVTLPKSRLQRFRDEYKSLLCVLAYLLDEDVKNISPYRLWQAIQEKDLK